MSNGRLIVYSLAILITVVCIPHAGAGLFNMIELDTSWVEGFFYVFNELSIYYIVVPFFVIEIIRYYVLKRLNREIILDSVTNVISVFAFMAINYVLYGLFILKLYSWAWEYRILEELPLTWLTVICCVVLADFLYYWEHRLMHRIGVGWLTHTVHHSSPHFNMSVAYRFGPLDGVFPLFFSVPAVMLGFSPFLIFGCELVVQTYQAILHTEMVRKLPRPIEYIFNTPSHHRVHH